MLAAAGLVYLLRRNFDCSLVRGYFTRQGAKLKAQRVVFGFLASGLCVALLLPWLVGSGKLVWSDESLGYFLQKALVKAIPAALVVSVLEEIVFRGLIFDALKKKVAVGMAAIFTSMLYASVHFIAPVKSFQYEYFDVWAGFEYLAAIFGRFLSGGLYPAMFGLFMVGLVLCYVMQRTGSLFLCIGLHTGWAAGFKIVKHVAVIPESAAVEAGLGQRYFLLAEPLSWLSVVLVLAVMVVSVEVLRLFRECEHSGGGGTL